MIFCRYMNSNCIQQPNKRQYAKQYILPKTQLCTGHYLHTVVPVRTIAAELNEFKFRPAQF